MKKLREVLLILLSSDQPGEIAAAAAVIRRELAKAGRDIHWLAEQLARIMEAPAVSTHVPGHVRRTAKEGIWWKQLEFVINKLVFLNDREVEFIESLFQQWSLKNATWTPSPKQLRWLDAIYNRLQQGDPFGRY